MRRMLIGAAIAAVVIAAGLVAAIVYVPCSAKNLCSWQSIVTHQLDDGRALYRRFAGLPPMTVAASTVDSNPYIVIEVGRHISAPRTMSVDAAGRILVTGSDDKTVRLWALPDNTHAGLQPLDVLRPPTQSGQGQVGRVNAVAVSPDGHLVAVAGIMTGNEDAEIVYIFNRVTGAIKKRLPVPSTGDSLAFSPDGRFLAAGAQKGGVRVWRSADWQQIAADNGYKKQIWGLAFAKDGRLAAASWDRGIRLYDAQFRRTATIVAPHGNIPFQIAFSPDGNRLAVGYRDSAAVTLFDGRTLKNAVALQEPGTIAADWSDWNFGSVTWSADGRYLFAAGSYREKIENIWCGVVRRWTLESGKTKDFTALHSQNIMALAPYRQSGVLVVASDPLIGAYDEEGRQPFAVGPSQHSIPRYVPEDPKRQSDDLQFRVSADGSVVELPGHRGQAMLRIDLPARRVSVIDKSDPTLAPRGAPAPGFEVDNASSGAVTKISWPDRSRKPLAFDRRKEVVRDVAFAPKGDLFALATTVGVRLYSADGKQSSLVKTPAGIWRVNITPDGRMVVASGQDGVVRWLRIETGKTFALVPLLQMFINEPDPRLNEPNSRANAPDGRSSELNHRWIAWTPQGYYDVSSGGEDLIGWQIDHDDHSALFYSASRFREVYYRPDIVKRAIVTAKITAAPSQAVITQHLPPVVRILDVTDTGQGKAVIRYSVDSPSGKPVTDLKLVVDGALQQLRGAAGLVKTGKPLTLEVATKGGGVAQNVLLSAVTKDGASDAASRSVETAGKGTSPQRGKLYALLIGVGHFKNSSIPQLHFTANDVNEFKAVLDKQEGRFYDKVKVVPLLNEKATRENIMITLRSLTQQVTERDVIMIFLTGHGVKLPMNGGKPAYVYLTYDVDNKNADNFFAKGLLESDLSFQLSRLAGRKFIFLDTCYAGALGVRDITGFSNQMRGDILGAVVLASSSADMPSLELFDYSHGAFTEALLEGFYGKVAHDDDGGFTSSDLDSWLNRRVKKLTGNPTAREINDVGANFATIVPK